MNIKKIKLRDGLFASIDYEIENGEATDTVNRECNSPVHDDFKTKLQAFAVHVAIICDYADASKLRGDAKKFKPPVLDDITVRGISIGAKEDGVIITFSKKLKNKKVFNGNTPFQKYNDEAVPYKYGDELLLEVEELTHEPKEYLAGRKVGPGQQLKMELPEDEPAPEETETEKEFA